MANGCDCADAGADYFFTDAPRSDLGAACVKKYLPANNGLRCRPEDMHCDSCGFNPVVRKVRIQKLLAQRQQLTIRKPEWGSSYEDVDIKCPYFKGLDTKNKYVVCDGAQKRTRLMLHISRRRDFEHTVERLCKCNFRECIIYQAIEHHHG